jgi:hypothetical protein
MEKINLEDGKIKGTEIVPEKIGATEKIYVPIRENCFFGGFVKFTPRKFNSCIEDRLSTLQLCDKNKEYSEVNAFAKARRNSKVHYVQGTLTEYYYAFIDFYKV